MLVSARLDHVWLCVCGDLCGNCRCGLVSALVPLTRLGTIARNTDVPANRTSPRPGLAALAMRSRVACNTMAA